MILVEAGLQLAAKTMRVAVIDDFQRVAAGMADWAALPADIAFFHDPLSDQVALARRLADFDIIVAMRERTRFDAALLDLLPRLRLITTMGRRNAAIDLEAATARGILVAGSPAKNTGPRGMPAFTWGLILALARRIPQEAQSVRSGYWQDGLGIDLEGKTLGLLGLGRIGSKVAEIGAAFGMHAIAWSENLTAETCAAAGVRRVERDELFAAADVLTIHLVLSDRTRNIVSVNALARMKPTALLINTARGGLIDEPALVDVLATGRLAGAALDTFTVEPLPANHPFRTLPNVLATPHIGFVTDIALAHGYLGMAETVHAFLRGHAVPELLNG